MRPTCFLIYFLLYNRVVTSNPISKMCSAREYGNNPSVKLLQEYIRIDTSKEKNIEYAVQFWMRQASTLGLPFAVYRPSGKPIGVITWRGRNPKLPSIILNSHMDVVPVAEQNWTYPPFSAYIDQNGNMFGRGTQDTKTLGITYLESVRTLIKSGVKLQRTLHLLLMPDEETGGLNGMIPFIDTKEFQALNPGFFFDEGIASPEDTVYVSYQDKRTWQLNLTLFGEGGHAATLPGSTAVEKLRRLLDVISNFRDQQRQIKFSREATDYGSYTSINVDVIKGGIAANVIPTQITVVIDMRLAVTSQVSDVEAMGDETTIAQARAKQLYSVVVRPANRSVDKVSSATFAFFLLSEVVIESWILQVGNDTYLSYIAKVEVAEATRLNDSNPYWVAVVDALKEKGIKFLPIVLPFASDMVSIRNRGIPAIGLAYLPNTKLLLHNIDEYINVATFLKGIQVYVHILQKVCNLP